MSKKAEKPIRIVKYRHGRKHKTEGRVFVREIHESYCVQKGCKFYGKRSAQGICDTRDTFYGGSFAYIDKMEKRIVEELKEAKKHFGKEPKKWVRYLESQHICDSMNTAFTLDELIRLRAENARLKLKAGEYK